MTAARPPSRAERARFLFRTENGTIDAPTWRLHAGWLAALLLAMTFGWHALQPYARHDLARSAFLAPMTVLAYAYLIVYAFAVLLVAVSYVMLSMKRFRDRHAPTGLAGLVPALALFAASLHFLRMQTPDVVPVWAVAALDLGLAGAVVWTIVELGVRRTARGGG